MISGRWLVISVGRIGDPPAQEAKCLAAFGGVSVVLSTITAEVKRCGAGLPPACGPLVNPYGYRGVGVSLLS